MLWFGHVLKSFDFLQCIMQQLCSTVPLTTFETQADNHDNRLVLIPIRVSGLGQKEQPYDYF